MALFLRTKQNFYYITLYYFSDEDEDIKMTVSGGNGAAVIETMNRAIAAKILDLRTCSSLICIFFFFLFFHLLLGILKEILEALF